MNMIAGIKFHFEKRILNFSTKYTQEKYVRLKPTKVNIPIEFCILELQPWS